ncbi:hypothetical protein [Streptomyces sp. Tue6028]|uniref:hypothetical protein n=1 Tax=Streptomyces sp. Tue6028 TaxID=2036037 RepID=UPI003D736DCC
MCLLTSDTPVAIWNRPDDENQIRAAALSDIMLPLDPHRFLFPPGSATQETDPRKRVDHLMHAEGTIGMALVEVAYNVADQFIVHHPQHAPWRHWKPSGSGQPKAWEGQAHSAPQYILEYDVFSPHQNSIGAGPSRTHHPAHQPHEADRETPSKDAPRTRACLKDRVSP